MLSLMKKKMYDRIWGDVGWIFYILEIIKCWEVRKCFKVGIYFENRN